VQTSCPRGATVWAKFQMLTIVGNVCPHFCTDKREICHRSPCLSVEFVAPGGEKPVFGPQSKRNTGMLPCGQACRS